MNILASSNAAQEQGSLVRPLVRVVVVGHVDHGKSTLIGRLLHETGNLPDGKLETVKAVSGRRGVPFEWSFVIDALQTERDQGITLDTTQIRLQTSTRDIVLIDAPGHAEFLRNMITGAAQADAALLLIDAVEGVREQTRRHAYLLHLLGIHQVAVVVNKMDRLDFDEGRFREIEGEIADRLGSFGLSATAIIPVSARSGDGVAIRSQALAWHTGPTVLEVLDRFAMAQPLSDLMLRIPVQGVYKFNDKRIVVGRVESGRIAVGDRLVIMPRGTTARVRSIEAWPVPDESRAPRAASAGRSIGLTFDRPVFVERGDVVAAVDAAPKAVRWLRGRVFWLDQQPLSVGDTINVRVGMSERSGAVTAIDNAVDPGALALEEVSHVAQNHVGEIEIGLTQPIAADLYAENPRTGRFVIDLRGRIAGGGLILSIDGEASRNAIERGEAREDVQMPAVGRAAHPGAHANDLVDEAERLDFFLRDLSPAERLSGFRREIDGAVVFATSFGLEDQAILHLIAEHDINVELVTLDTGRLFRETYDLWAESEARYGRRIRPIYPQHAEVEAVVDKYGINGFYASREARLACCHVRKVAPLGRALAGAAAWIVGLRADQSRHRRQARLVDVDGDRGILKLSPFIDWTRDAVVSFASTHQVPINPLHLQGFASIGCAPCTRAIAAGEPERAGRWWWEQVEKKECGLHIKRDQIARLSDRN